MAIMPSCFPFETLVVQSYSSSSWLLSSVFNSHTFFARHLHNIKSKLGVILSNDAMNNFLLFFWVVIIFFSAAEYRRRAEQFGRDCAGAELRDSDLQRNRHSAINGPLAA
jgi:hypothetical protein